MPTEWNLFYILTVAYAVICAAVVVYLTTRSGTGRLIKALIQSGASTPETAQTLDKLGCNTALIRFFLRDGGGLTKTVCTPDRHSKSELRRINGRRTKSIDFSSARFYLPPELTEKAKHLYVGKRTNPAALIISLVLLAVVLAALYFIIPAVFDLSGSGITV